MIAASITANKNFGLTETAFLEMSTALRNGDERLFEQVFLGKFEQCMAFLKSRYSASHNDAYDTVMWSLLRFRQLLLDGKIAYGNMEAYLLRIAITKHLKSIGKQQELTTDTLPELAASIGDDPLDEESLTLLAEAWKRLGDFCQRLLKGFYYDRIDLKQLTVLLEDTSEANTRKRKERCIKELRKYFFELE